MTPKFFEEKRPHNGLKYDEYMKLFAEEIADKEIIEKNEKGSTNLNALKLNYQRSARVNKTYKPSEGIKKVLAKIEKPQLWMVLTENWCGDSAQNLPYIAKIAELSEKIDLRILLRDDNPDIMDLYLTNGTSRSIPKLVAFDYKGNELFKWGPRPKRAQEMVEEWKASGLSKDEFIEKLHLWYARNKGEELEKEFIELLK